ncbi:MAG TPA: GMC family oxidoreductase [Solirubrobacteraceae bacterium]|nr:GMC family oxidoreductase [Solirubrobacteraceae bacterium]
MSEHYDVIVAGSGAGGGIIAAELAQAGRDVLLLEAGPHLSARHFTRWEAHANHTMWYPVAFAESEDGGAPIPMFRARVIGGTTTVNTKVALRIISEDYDKWHDATGIVGDGGEPLGEADLAAHYERVERRLGVRPRTDWQRCVTSVAPAFDRAGVPLHAVDSYTDVNCTRCGSCLQGCPTNAGKNTFNVYIQDAVINAGLTLRSDSTVNRVLIEDRGDGLEATGAEWTGAGGVTEAATADVIVVAGGALATPGILLRSGIRELTGNSPSSMQIGLHLGFHAAQIITGLFDEIQDAHDVYPITAHSLQRMRDADGGYIIEAATIQDPIGASVALAHEDGTQVWGQELVDVMRNYRRLNGLLTMTNDENNGECFLDAKGRDRYRYRFTESERRRIAESQSAAAQILRSAGATRVFATGVVSTHVQGSCRMGSDPERSALNSHAESHDVRRLFVGDSSVIPRVISVNPSLTVMAMASRTAHYLLANEHGYLPAAVPA